MTTEAKEGLNPAIDSLRSLSLTAFRRRYSADNPDLPTFGMHDVYATSTEAVSTKKFAELPVRGGIHLSVAGGLDTPLTQVATVKPELSILCDVNSFAMPMIQTRLQLLNQAADGRQYWELFRWALAQDPRLTPSLERDSFFKDYLGGGWSSFEHFAAVKQAWKKGAIKVVHSDIATDGILTGMQIAKKTGVPIRLINLSNIFDSPINRGKIRSFKSVLGAGLRNGEIDPESRVVATSIHDYLEHKIWLTKDFADPRRSLI